MYLHVGGDYLVRTDEIIAVFDIENTSISKITREFLKKSEEDKRVITVSFDIPRSFIVDKHNKIFISPISAATLLKRINTDSCKQ
ncbi:MAG: DUF370 domain-containing protein [Bacillota bacterium]|nr:DUF370 domain-containing protein [Bacillota bacterium]